MSITQDGQVVDFSSVKVEDEGRYVCTATNDAGDARRTHRVVVQGTTVFGLRSALKMLKTPDL